MVPFHNDQYTSIATLHIFLKYAIRFRNSIVEEQTNLHKHPIFGRYMDNFHILSYAKSLLDELCQNQAKSTKIRKKILF